MRKLAFDSFFKTDDIRLIGKLSGLQPFNPLPELILVLEAFLSVIFRFLAALEIRS